jgi:hypothetical protein
MASSSIRETGMVGFIIMGRQFAMPVDLNFGMVRGCAMPLEGFGLLAG